MTRPDTNYYWIKVLPSKNHLKQQNMRYVVCVCIYFFIWRFLEKVFYFIAITDINTNFELSLWNLFFSFNKQLFSFINQPLSQGNEEIPTLNQWEKEAKI